MPVTPDTIERSIDITATQERVFELVAKPGWWINEGRIVDNPVTVDGDISTVTHAKYGTFRIRTVELKPHEYAAFRWLGGDPELESEAATPGNLVEFWVTPTAGGGVTLRVRESGFQSLSADEEVRRRNFEANTAGWIQELEAARVHVESVAS